MTKLCQTLIVRKGRILLGTWKKGPFAGRVTGLLGKTKFDAETPEQVAKRQCFELAEVNVEPSLVSRRALFAFLEKDAEHPSAQDMGNTYVEHQLIYNADLAEYVGANPLGKPKETDDFVPKWYPLDKLPYKDMPEDDEWWYPRVLQNKECNKRERLLGEFTFQGSELDSHSVQSVTAHGGDLLDDGSLWGSKIDDMETLARQVSRKVSDEPNVAYLEDNENEKKQKDKEEAAANDEEEQEKTIVPVVIHNPNCSKSRAFIATLTKEGITHNVRDFQSNPLSLSEIETIDARINQTNNNEEQPISIFRGDIKNCKFFCDDKHEEHDEHEVTLAMLALNPLELLERPIVVFGEEAKIGRPEPNDLIAWLKERGVTSE